MAWTKYICKIKFTFTQIRRQKNSFPPHPDLIQVENWESFCVATCLIFHHCPRGGTTLPAPYGVHALMGHGPQKQKRVWPPQSPPQPRHTSLSELLCKYSLYVWISPKDLNYFQLQSCSVSTSQGRPDEWKRKSVAGLEPALRRKIPVKGLLCFAAAATSQFRANTHHQFTFVLLWLIETWSWGRGWWMIYVADNIFLKNLFPEQKDETRFWCKPSHKRSLNCPWIQ